MKKKRVLALIMMLALVFNFFSFTGLEVLAEEKLAAPTNLRWEGTKAVWDAVEDANYYMIDIYKDDTPVLGSIIVTENEYDAISLMNSNGGGKYTFYAWALKNHPMDNDSDKNTTSYRSDKSPEYNLIRYNISLDSYLSSFCLVYNEEEDCNESLFVETASPGDRIIIQYDQYTNSIPKGKYVKDIKYTGIDNTSEGFVFDEGGSFGAGIIFDMPENDVSFETVLGDTEDYIIDLSKDNITISEAVWLCFANSTYNSEPYSWKESEKDSNNVYWYVIDIDSDGTWDIKISGQESKYESYKVIKNPNTNLNSLIRLTTNDDYRPNYYICLDFEDKEEGTLDNATAPNDNYAGAALSNTVEEIKTSVLTEEDKEALKSGEDIKVWLDVDDITTTVSKTDKDKVEASKPKGYSVGSYLNIDLFKKIGSDKEKKVSDVPNGKVKVEISIPVELQKKGRTFKVVRLHNDAATVLSTTLNGMKLTFETDQFSTYALVYSDTATDTKPDASVKTVDMYRLYNPNSGEHFYTASAGEKDHLVSVGWNYEGLGWKAPSSSNTPVYRLYNPNAGDHHYTKNKAERDMLISVGWNDEGIGWYSDDAEGVPLYRQYNPNAVAGSHNYTTNKAENDYLASIGWSAEGVGWYGVK